jgi:hypothetical protein
VEFQFAKSSPEPHTHRAFSPQRRTPEPGREDEVREPSAPPCFPIWGRIWRQRNRSVDVQKGFPPGCRLDLQEDERESRPVEIRHAIPAWERSNFSISLGPLPCLCKLPPGPCPSHSQFSTNQFHCFVTPQLRRELRSVRQQLHIWGSGRRRLQHLGTHAGGRY